jgi:hypothetical protein
MGYYMRFYDTHKKPLRLAQLRTALRRQDRAYDIEILDPSKPQAGVLKYGGIVYAEIEVSESGEESFDEDLGEQLAAVVRRKGKAKSGVEEILRDTKRIVIVCVRFGTKAVEDTLVRIDPLWNWLFATRSGLLHAEDEGFYDDNGLILSL